MQNGVFFDKGSWLNLKTNSYYSKEFFDEGTWLNLKTNSYYSKEFFDKGTWLNLKTNSYYSKEFNSLLKPIIMASDVVSDALKAKLEI